MRRGNCYATAGTAEQISWFKSLIIPIIFVECGTSEFVHLVNCDRREDQGAKNMESETGGSHRCHFHFHLTREVRAP